VVTSALRSVAMLGYTLGLITWVTYFTLPDSPSRTPTIEQMRRLQKALDYSERKMESFRSTR